MDLIESVSGDESGTRESCGAVQQTVSADLSTRADRIN